MLRGLRSQRRCCVATLGAGATALPEVYADLYGSIIIWLGELGTAVEASKAAGCVCPSPGGRVAAERRLGAAQASGEAPRRTHTQARSARPWRRRPGSPASGRAPPCT